MVRFLNVFLVGIYFFCGTVFSFSALSHPTHRFFFRLSFLRDKGLAFRDQWNISFPLNICLSIE